MNAKRAAEALAELYVFAAVGEILEGSTAPRSTAGQKAANRILAICEAHQQNRLREYDKQVGQQQEASRG